MRGYDPVWDADWTMLQEEADWWTPDHWSGFGDSALSCQTSGHISKQTSRQTSGQIGHVVAEPFVVDQTGPATSDSDCALVILSDLDINAFLSEGQCANRLLFDSGASWHACSLRCPEAYQNISFDLSLRLQTVTGCDITVYGNEPNSN